MRVIDTELKDAVLIIPKRFNDMRGYFTETFNRKKLDEHIGSFNVVQMNVSKSRQGVFRGLHFQRPPFTQAKIVEAIKGTVKVVIVDIRTDSPTFGKYQGFFLDENDGWQLFVPRGFAHGFETLSISSKFQYKVDNDYSPAHEGGIVYNDPDLDIEWGVEMFSMNDRDKQHPRFSEQTFWSEAEYHANPLG